MKKGNFNGCFFYWFALIMFPIFLLIEFSSCKKLDAFPDSPLVDDGQTAIIMHRGGGFSGEGRNTLDGAIYGMSVADGIELDIQMSRDNTLWVQHEARIENCGDYPKECFIQLSDHEIEERIGCTGFYTFKLESIFKVAQEQFPDATIVLDCKAWLPCALSQVNTNRLMKMMGTQIIHLAGKYQLLDNVIVDSNVKALIKLIDEQSSIKTYYRSFASLDKAARNAFAVNADGLSLDQNRFGLTPEDVQLLNRKGLEVQLWTINDTESLNEVLELKPQQVLSEVDDSVR